jgi:type I restriction enzyme, S subunit
VSFTYSLSELVANNPNGLLSKHASWERIPLKEVFRVQNGFPFESRFFNTQGRGVPLLRIRDVTSGRTETFYDGKYSEDYMVCSGDVVVGMDGDFRARIWSGSPALLNQRVCRLVPIGDSYHPRLLVYAIQGYLDAIHSKTSSVTVKHLSSRTIEQIPLPLPPNSEQIALVDALESHFSRIDAALETLNSAGLKLRSLRKSVLKWAFEGRLVEQANGESANELPERIGSDSVDNRRSKKQAQRTKTKATK